jgi:ribose 5-phosphate isomerase A
MLLAHRHAMRIAAISVATGYTISNRYTNVMCSEKTEQLKRLVGYKSVDDYVTSGMVVGLGTGSTAKYAVERIGQKIKSGELKNIVAIPTSEGTKQQALSLDIPLSTLNEHSVLDVVIDGADEVDPQLQLIKGGGGALLREKMVETVAKKFIVIVDESKLVKKLGPKFPLPVEIIPFCHVHTSHVVESLSALDGCTAVLRHGSISNNKNEGTNIAVTDNGNYIIDLHFSKSIENVTLAAKQLTETVGVVEHGLFTNMATCVIVAMSDGSIRTASTTLQQSTSSNIERPWW